MSRASDRAARLLPLSFVGRAAVLLTIVLAAACVPGRGPVSSPPSTATPLPAFAAPQPTPGQVGGLEIQRWADSSDRGGYAILATTDLARGPQRFAVVLTDETGLVNLPVVQMRTYYYREGFESGKREGPAETVTARFHEFPLGTRGLYATSLDFNELGDWEVEADVPRSDGSVLKAAVRFSIGHRTYSLPVGAVADASVNRTLKDVPSIGYLTTGSHRDPGLYQTTIADALMTMKPTIVVFASPAFCTNAVCGPQVEVLSEIREEFGARANYVHIDYYENPHEIQGDLTKAVPSKHLAAWGLTSQEWTYVIGRDGKITARFENFAPRKEIKDALEAALAAGVPPR